MSPHVMQQRLRSAIPRLIAGGMLLAFGILVAPYSLPPSGSTASASALLGFNNTLAYLLYVPLLAGTAWIVSTFIRWPEVGVFAVPSQFLPAPSAWVWGVLAAHATLFFLLYTVKGQFVFSEALYFQHAAYRVLLGEIPYAEFSFLYGPLTIYPQAVLAQIMSPTAAYALYYVSVYVLGLYALYVALVWLGLGGRRADVVFILLSIGFFNPMTGLNYTPLRHLLPLLAVLGAWSYVIAGTWPRLIGGSVILWLAVIYSPDVGAVALMGVLLTGGMTYAATRFFGWRPSDSAPGVLGLGKLLGLAAVLTVAAFAVTEHPISSLTQYIAVVMRLAGGGSNTPLQPSVPLASLVALTAVVGGTAVAAVRTRGMVQDSMALAVLVLTLLIFQRAAFAKPDILHLAFIALPMFLVALRLFGSDTKRMIPVPLMLGLFGLVMPLQYYNAAALWPAVASRWSTGQSDGQMTPTMRPQTPIPDQLQIIVSRMGRGTPYYMHNLTYYSLPVHIRNRLRYALYFTTPEEAFTEGDVQRVIHTLATRDAIVIMLRKEFDGSAGLISTGSGLRRAVNMLAASAVSGSITYDATAGALKTLWNPFLSYLRRCYEVRAETSDLVGLMRSHDSPSCRESIGS